MGSRRRPASRPLQGEMVRGQRPSRALPPERRHLERPAGPDLQARRKRQRVFVLQPRLAALGGGRRLARWRRRHERPRPRGHRHHLLTGRGQHLGAGHQVGAVRPSPAGHGRTVPGRTQQPERHRRRRQSDAACGQGAGARAGAGPGGLHHPALVGLCGRGLHAQQNPGRRGRSAASRRQDEKRARHDFQSVDDLRLHESGRGQPGRAIHRQTALRRGQPHHGQGRPLLGRLRAVLLGRQRGIVLSGAQKPESASEREQSVRHVLLSAGVQQLRRLPAIRRAGRGPHRHPERRSQLLLRPAPGPARFLLPGGGSRPVPAYPPGPGVAMLALCRSPLHARPEPPCCCPSPIC